MSWQPIADGELAAKLRESVDEITAALIELLGQPDPYGSGNLSGGSAGIGLYFAHLAEWLGDDAAADHAEKCFDHAADELSDHAMPMALYHGICGIPWAMDVAYSLGPSDQGEVEEEDDEDDDELFAHVHDAVSATPWNGDYDLISGLVGVGVYALASPSRAPLVELVSQRLCELADVGDHGARWHTEARLISPWQQELAPAGYYNFGPAHGIPGVVWFLAKVAQLGIGDSRCGELYQQGARYLLENLRGEGELNRFPVWIRVGGGADASRFGWCYGDPGTTATLASAAQFVGDEKTLTAVTDLARRAAKRAVADTDVDDAPLCHGSAGMAHIFNRFFQRTRDPVFADAARMWLADSLARRTDDGVAGYTAVDDKTEGDELIYVGYPGLLSGAAGIGLAYLSALGDREPAWDRFLLLS